MEEMSPVVVLPVSAAANPLRDNLDEINRLHFVAGSAGLLSEQGGSDFSGGNLPQHDDEAALMTAEEGGDNENAEVRSLPGSDDDDSTSVESVCSISESGAVAMDALPASSEISAEQCSSSAIRVRVTEANINLEVRDLTNPAIHVSQEEERSGRNAFVLNYIPLWGFVSLCGRRPEMEDAAKEVPWFHEIPINMLNSNHLVEGANPGLATLPAHFFGVYDGHGGAQVANYCRERMHLALIEEIKNVSQGFRNMVVDDWHKLWETAFTNCFLKVDDEVGGVVRGGQIESTADASEVASDSIVPSEPIAPETVGSTAVVAIICCSHIIIANCGDSRAVLCRGKQPLPLSVDHKPNREDEHARIEAAGGKVIQWNGYRVFGVLAMSRSIGDRYLKPWIIPEPEVRIVPRTREDECLILASDGLWDVLSNEEVCDAARKRILLWHKKNGSTSSSRRGEAVDPAAQAAADYLSRLALQRGSKDNVTVIVVDLKAQRKFKNKTKDG